MHDIPSLHHCGVLCAVCQGRVGVPSSPTTPTTGRCILLPQSPLVPALHSMLCFLPNAGSFTMTSSPQVQAFGEVVRRIWSPSNFKSAVSPHEFIQAVSYASKKRFRPGVQAEAVDFLSWLLNALHQVRVTITLVAVVLLFVLVAYTSILQYLCPADLSLGSPSHFFLLLFEGWRRQGAALKNMPLTV